MPAAKPANHRPIHPRQLMRQKVAMACQLMLAQVSPPKLSPTLAAGLSPRLRDTLQLLLAGDSEKEVAGKLRLSPHTVHIHVKSLYKRLNVCTRAELMAK
jgi:DNA-binding NarL/FixJ family response regulator